MKKVKAIRISGQDGPTPPSKSGSPVEWIERLERMARACRSNHVRMRRDHAIKMCLLLRLVVRFIEQVDLENSEQARALLHEFVDMLPEREKSAAIEAADLTRKAA